LSRLEQEDVAAQMQYLGHRWRRAHGLGGGARTAERHSAGVAGAGRRPRGDGPSNSSTRVSRGSRSGPKLALSLSRVKIRGGPDDDTLVTEEVMGRGHLDERPGRERPGPVERHRPALQRQVGPDDQQASRDPVRTPTRTTRCRREGQHRQARQDLQPGPRAGPEPGDREAPTAVGGGFRTKRDAEKELAERSQQPQAGTYVEPTKQTVR
jgi:hypothetical protein